MRLGGLDWTYLVDLFPLFSSIDICRVLLSRAMQEFVHAFPDPRRAGSKAVQNSSDPGVGVKVRTYW